MAALVEDAKLHLVSTAGDFESTISGLRWQWRLLDRFRNRVDLWWSMLQPNALDWQWARLHSSLYPAYYLVKPLRLAAKYILPR